MFLLLPLLGSKNLCPRLRRRVVYLRNFPLLTSLFLNLSMFPHLFKWFRIVWLHLQALLVTIMEFPGFGPSSFPGRFRSKDFQIHNSSIGKSAPTCDKAMASLLGSKSVEGLRLTQSLWSKSENLLRSTSHALGTAEHFLSTAGSLL